MWAGVVAGKYRTGSSYHHPAIRKQNSENNFKPPLPPNLSPNSPPEQPNINETKLTRSQTYFDYPRRFSNSSNDSYSGTSSRRGSNQSTASSSGYSRRGGINTSSSGQNPVLNSSRGYKKRANLGRSNLAVIKAETSVDLVVESGAKTDDSSSKRSHMFY